MDALSQEVGEIFHTAAPSVVRVIPPGPSILVSGSGFLIDSEGTILTSAAIVGKASKVYVEYQGNKIEATVVHSDRRSGIALLRIHGYSTLNLKFGDSDKVQIAQTIVSIGYPHNLPASPSLGTIAGFDVQYLQRFFATTHIRANIPISPGQIGGPLLNSKGEVVGLLVMGVEDGKGCYAIPSKAAQKIVQDILKYGHAQHGWVGVGVTQVEDPKKGAKWVRISHLFPDTAAQKSGLRAGDKLLQIGSRNIYQPSDILDVAFYSKIGDTITVHVARNGEPLDFTIEVQQRPTQFRLAQSAKYVPHSLPQNSEEHLMQVKGSR